jgi:glycosyltransferase involved in cell wall biosynthesis
VPKLLVCHVSELARAADRLTGDASGGLDIVCYGRAAKDAPVPPGAIALALPSTERGRLRAARTAIALVRRMRRQRYDVAVIIHPGLEDSWFRGPLLLFPHVAGARKVVAVSPAGQHEVVTTARAFGDVLQWCALLAASVLFARVAAALVERMPAKSPHVELPTDGSVAYLRTDVELRGMTLAAGGSMAHTAGIVNAMRRRGYDVSFWSTGDVAGVRATECMRLPVVVRANVPLEVSELISGLRQGLTRDRGPRATAFVYQRYSLNNLAGLLLARRWGVPLVLEVNDSEVRWRSDWSRLRLPRLARACERALLRRADLVITVSDNVRRDLLEEGADPDRLRTVPNGVDAERFAGATPRPLPVPREAFVIAFVGLFYPWHGVHVLAQAFVLLHRRRQDARLLLIGDGEEAARTRAILEDGGAGGAFLMPGLVAREDVPAYLKAADVLVSPHANIRNFIGSPIKIFEYMASGRAIVATRVGQIADVLRHRETALIVAPEDPAALADALMELHDDPGLRRRLGAAAQAEALAAHSWDARVAAIVRACDCPERADAMDGRKGDSSPAARAATEAPWDAGPRANCAD